MRVTFSRDAGSRPPRCRRDGPARLVVQRRLAAADWNIPEWVGSRPRERLPEAWIGQLVVVRRVSGHEHMVVLRDVREFGILYTMAGTREPVFSPWSAISWLRLAQEDTQPGEPPT